MDTVLFLEPPSPPGMIVSRDWAGGFGVATRVERDDYGHGKYTIPYVSLMYSAGILARQQYRVIYLDAQAERLNAVTTIAKVCRHKPDVIVAVVSLPSIYSDGRFLRRLKRECPGIRTICIGTVCRVLPDVLANMNAGDFIVLGEPESVLPDLVRGIQEDSSVDGVRGVGVVRDGQLSKTGPSTVCVDLKKLPWPPHDIMPIALYHEPPFGAKDRCFPVWASRGCPMPCSFYCPYPIGMGRTVRLRPCDDFVKEIVHLNRKFGVTAFVFRDQLFSSRLDRAKEICDLLIDERLKIRWVCETRFDMVSEELLTKMRRAGCRGINFGLETGDPDLLHKTGKPGTKISTVKNAVRLTKKAGIKPSTHIILGLPGESHSTVQRTLKTLRELGITSLSVNFATPYPGTQLFEYAKEHGLVETEDWSRFTSFNPVMRSEWMSTQELKESEAFLIENLLGRTLLEKVEYLCKNKAIIDALAAKLTAIRDEPLSLLGFLRRHVSPRRHDAVIRKR